MKPFFIAIDGVDGTGKSTQVELLVKWLAKRGYSVEKSCEPGGTSTGKKIRALLVSKESQMETDTELLLFLADRAEHQHKVIRLLKEGKSVVTAYDTEPFRNLFPGDPNDPSYDQFAFEEGELVVSEQSGKIFNFIQGADVLIHDAQYTQEELEKSYLGWGHSSFEHVIKTAHKAGIKKVYFFHHDPQRSDSQLEALVAGYRKKIQGKTKLELEIAREGEGFTI